MPVRNDIMRSPRQFEAQEFLPLCAFESQDSPAMSRSIGAVDNHAHQVCQDDSLSAWVFAKYRAPTGCCFYVVEHEQETGICYGFIGGDVNEWGYFSVSGELASRRDIEFHQKSLGDALEEEMVQSKLPPNRTRAELHIA